MDKNVTVESIADETKIRPFEVVRILSVVSAKESIDNREFIRLTGLPRTRLRRLLRSIRGFLQPTSRVISCSPQGRQRISQILQDAHNSKFTKVFSHEDEVRIHNVMEKLSSIRPSADRTLDQFSATVKTLIRRAEILSNLGHIQDQKVLFLGDNDLTSIAVACLEVCTGITVIDIDCGVLEIIERAAALEGLTVETIWHDTRKELEPRLLRLFDVCFTDPPYTESGVRLFTSRAIQTLKEGSDCLVYLNYGYSADGAERALRIQHVITESGLVIEAKFPSFNTYYGAESIGSRSSLYLCSTTDSTRPLVKGTFSRLGYTSRSRAPRMDAMPEHLRGVVLGVARTESGESVACVGPNMDTVSRLISATDRLPLVAPLSQNWSPKENQSDDDSKVSYAQTWDTLEEYLQPFNRLVAAGPLAVIRRLLGLLSTGGFQSMVLVIRRDIADRIMSSHGDIHFGYLGLLTRCFFDAEICRPEELSSLLAQTPDTVVLTIRPVNKMRLLSEPRLFVMREVAEQRDKLLKNAMIEALIRYAKAKGGSMTKNRARQTIADNVTNSAILNQYLENLNDQDTSKLYSDLGGL